jgi:2-C-methyl-D-erythritol 4-phosphate cytidylyltransferase
LDLLAAADCDPIVVVVPEDLLEPARGMTGGRDGVEVVAGGPNRRESIYAGLKMVTSEVVVIHDAARPFATVEMVTDAVTALDDWDAVVTGIILEDTIKRVDQNAVIKTIDRAGLWRIQTPQVFRTSVLKGAHERAHRDGLEASDDAQIVEHYGGRVGVVQGRRDNIKLTFEEDFSLAEAMAAARDR